MQLTRYTDYGLRLLTYLATLPEEKRASISEISDIYDISRNNINKVVHQLGKAGIIDTKQGKGGGFCLKKSSEEINLADVVLLLEKNISLIDCQVPPCKIASLCVLKNIFQEAQNALLSVFKKYTLADLVEPKREELVQLFELNS